MKKAIKSVILLTITIIMIIMLTGCGNKLVATKTTEDLGMKFEETIEVKFKNDAANEVKIIYEFDNEKDAVTYHDYISPGFLPKEIEIEQKGKKITINVQAEDFGYFGPEMKGKAKNDVKKEFEEDGYKVK